MLDGRDAAIETQLEIAVRGYEVEVAAASDDTHRLAHLGAAREILLDTLADLHGQAAAADDDAAIERIQAMWRRVEGTGPAARAKPRPRRVTVIDGAPDVRDLLREVLTDAGYEVSSFDGERLTVEDLVRIGPDVVLLDLHLSPGAARLTGWELLRLMRAHRQLHEVPIVVCTSDGAALRRHRAELARMPRVSLLRKPFDLATVERLVAEALETNDADARLASGPLAGAPTLLRPLDH